MTVFSSSTCPRCKVLKMKLDKAGFVYDVCEDIDVMMGLGIKSIPMVQLENGQLLDFGQAIALAKEVEVSKYEN